MCVMVNLFLILVDFHQEKKKALLFPVFDFELGQQEAPIAAVSMEDDAQVSVRDRWTAKLQNRWTSEPCIRRSQWLKENSVDCNTSQCYLSPCEHSILLLTQIIFRTE